MITRLCRWLRVTTSVVYAPLLAAGYALNTVYKSINDVPSRFPISVSFYIRRVDLREIEILRARRNTNQHFSHIELALNS